MFVRFCIWLWGLIVDLSLWDSACLVTTFVLYLGSNHAHIAFVMQIFSLWCVSPKAKGGLGFTTADVGTLLALSGTEVFYYYIDIYNLLNDCFLHFVWFFSGMIHIYGVGLEHAGLFEKDSQCKAFSNHYHHKSILWFLRKILTARGLVCLLDRLRHACVPTFIFPNFGKLFGTNTHYSNWCGRMLNLCMNHALTVDADRFILCRFWSCFNTMANPFIPNVIIRNN